MKRENDSLVDDRARYCIGSPGLFTGGWPGLGGSGGLGSGGSNGLGSGGSTGLGRGGSSVLLEGSAGFGSGGSTGWGSGGSTGLSGLVIFIGSFTDKLLLGCPALFYPHVFFSLIILCFIILKPACPQEQNLLQALPGTRCCHQRFCRAVLSLQTI